MPTLVNKQTYLESGQKSETKGFSGVSYIDALLNRGVDEGRGDDGGPIKWASDPYLTEEGLDSSITTIYSVSARTSRNDIIQFISIELV